LVRLKVLLLDPLHAVLSFDANSTARRRLPDLFGGLRCGSLTQLVRLDGIWHGRLVAGAVRLCRTVVVGLLSKATYCAVRVEV